MAKALSRLPAKWVLAKRFYAANSCSRWGRILSPRIFRIRTWRRSALILALADELAVLLPKDADQHQLLKSINLRLLNLAAQGKRVLLCLDEAQAIPVDSLEALRLLTNLETEKRKLLQIVLFGQPELDAKLALPEIRQLAQRITFHYHLGPLSRDDVEFYVAHRLRVAGSTARACSAGARWRGCMRPAAAFRAWSISWRTSR